EASRMIVVSMGDDDKVQSFKIDFQRGNVVGEPRALSTGVEQDAPAAVLDEDRVTPPALQARWLAERIEQHPGARRFLGAGACQNQRREQACSGAAQEV